MQTYTHTVFAQIQTYAVDVGPAVHNLVSAPMAYACLDFEVECADASIHAPAVQTEHIVLASTDTEQTVAPAWLSGEVTSESQYTIRIASQSVGEAPVRQTQTIKPIETIATIEVVSDVVVSDLVSAELSQLAVPIDVASCIHKRSVVTRWRHPTACLAKRRQRRPLMHQGSQASYRYAHAAVGPPQDRARVRHRAQSP